MTASAVPILSAADKGLLGSQSTSIIFKDTEKFPYFWRTIPSDAMQAQGLILLCREFEWTSVAIIYINDDYGLYLSLGLHELAEQYDISATSYGITYEDEETIVQAAEQ